MVTSPISFFLNGYLQIWSPNDGRFPHPPFFRRCSVKCSHFLWRWCREIDDIKGALWPVFREQADLLITTFSGMTIVSLQMSFKSSPTSCVIRTYAVLVLFQFLHQHTMRTWLPSEPGIIWWIKNTIGE